MRVEFVRDPDSKPSGLACTLFDTRCGKDRDGPHQHKAFAAGGPFKLTIDTDGSVRGLEVP